MGWTSCVTYNYFYTLFWSHWPEINKTMHLGSRTNRFSSEGTMYVLCLSVVLVHFVLCSCCGIKGTTCLQMMLECKVFRGLLLVVKVRVWEWKQCMRMIDGCWRSRFTRCIYLYAGAQSVLIIHYPIGERRALQRCPDLDKEYYPCNLQLARVLCGLS